MYKYNNRSIASHRTQHGRRFLIAATNLPTSPPDSALALAVAVADLPAVVVVLVAHVHQRRRMQQLPQPEHRKENTDAERRLERHTALYL